MTEEEFFKRYSFNVREDKIGGGSFGTVYRAYDNVLDREVAVKVSEVRISGDKEFSLREEFKAIEKLPPHANIANYEEVHTFESFNGVFDYAIMQYYPLGNLDHFLSKNELSQEKKETLVLAILDGIAHLHKHHIVQRDLKPSNILVVDRKGKLIPKITDFGLSKQANADSNASRFTNSFAGGTLQYCSPEQIKGLPLKLNTDLWSFGAIAYEIFTGKALFQVEGSTSASAEWQNEVSKKILHEDYSAKLVELPGNWPAVVAACLERDMNERVKDAEELLKTLKGETSVEDSAATQILPQADNNATQIFSKEPVEKKREEISSESVTEKAPVKKTPEKNKQKKQDVKSTLPKPQSSKKKVWMGIAAGLITAVAVAYGFTYMNTSDSENQSSAEIAEIPVVFKKDSLFGYKSNGKIVIHPSFIMADGFIEGKAKVSTKDSTFFIDTKGEWAASYSDDKREEAIADNTTNKKGDDQDYNETGSEKMIVSPEDLKLKEWESIYERALQYHADENYSKSYELFFQLGEEGYKEAEFQLGKYYQYGLGRDKDFFIADLWYSKAVDQTHALALNNIGEMYESGGNGIDQDYKEALKKYRAAANLGEPIAMVNLGNLLTKGKGVEKNYNEAFEWYLKASKKGNLNSYYGLGRAYYYGYGVKENNKNSFEWFHKSAAKGHSDSMVYLGIMNDNYAGRYNWEKAREWYSKAVELENNWARRMLAEFYLFGVGGVNQDIEKTKILLNEAANNGDWKAKNYLKVLEDAENANIITLDEGIKNSNNKLVLNNSKSIKPVILQNYDDFVFNTISYEKDSSYETIDILPNGNTQFLEIKNDGYTGFTDIGNKEGKVRPGIRFKKISENNVGGYRGIGYIYYRGTFKKNGSRLDLKILKVPAMVCWKPKRYY